MGSSEENRLPPGYRVLPLDDAAAYCPLTLCLIVRDADPKSSPETDRKAGCILLRDLPDADVYLGALADWDNVVHGLVEIWIQRVDGFSRHYPENRDASTNGELDRRWRDRVNAFCALGGADIYITGWEEEHPDPLFLDAAFSKKAAIPGEEGSRWRLCLNEELLASCELPGYAASAHRYLWNGAEGEDARFIPVTADAPENDKTLERDSRFKDLAPINPEGGLLMVRKFHPLNLEEFVDLLGGESWTGVARLGSHFRPPGIYDELADMHALKVSGKGFLTGYRGTQGQLMEVLHLKLCLYLDVFRLVRRYVRVEGRPFLNLSPQHFGVRVADVSTGLPYLWAFQAGLREPGEALSAAAEMGGSERLFVPSVFPRESVYRAGSLSLVTSGQGTVRIRKVVPEGDGKMASLEGTLATDEGISPGRKDVLKLRLNMGSRRLELSGQIIPSAAGAHGEYRFRTFPRRIDSELLRDLGSEEGLSTFAATPFTVIPILGPPCDLYSLGVMALRIFLVDGSNALPVIVDEVLSLARLLGESGDGEESVGHRLRKAASENNPEHWKELLGPHHLVRERIARETAMASVPRDLWWDLMALVICLFPGSGDDGFYADFSDFNSSVPDQVFDEPIEVLEALARRTRSLVTGDWVVNREIAGEIRSIIRSLDE